MNGSCNGLPSARAAPIRSAIRSRTVRVVSVDTTSPSPFAQSLAFQYVANFLYEGDAYYDLADWDGFEDYLSGRGRELMMLRVHRAQVLDVCPRCAGDSHAAYLGPGFAGAFYDSHVQPLIDRARRRLSP